MSNETQWWPDPKDVEDLTIALLKGQPSHSWVSASLFALVALAHLHRQGRLLPPVPPPLVTPPPDEPELPLDDGDTIAGHIDLSALSTPPMDRDADWFEQVGLK